MHPNQAIEAWRLVDVKNRSYSVFCDVNSCSVVLYDDGIDARGAARGGDQATRLGRAASDALAKAEIDERSARIK